MQRILVVDDEPGITKVLRELLTHLKYTVVTACNGRDALEKLALGPVDLMITDILMPEMDGLQLIAEVRKSNPTLKIVAISGGGKEGGPGGYLREAQELGAVRSIAKPFMLSELSALIKELLETKPAGETPA